jgi:hypothetical protein
MSNHVCQVHRMTHEAVRASHRQTPQRREDAEQSGQAEEAGEVQTSCECHKDKPYRKRRGVAWHRPKITDLGIRVDIRHDNGSAGGQRKTCTRGERRMRAVPRTSRCCET